MTNMTTRPYQDASDPNASKRLECACGMTQLESTEHVVRFRLIPAPKQRWTLHGYNDATLVSPSWHLHTYGECRIIDRWVRGRFDETTGEWLQRHNKTKAGTDAETGKQ